MSHKIQKGQDGSKRDKNNNQIGIIIQNTSLLLSKAFFWDLNFQEKGSIRALEKLRNNKWPSTELIFQEFWLVEGDY